MQRTVRRGWLLGALLLCGCSGLASHGSAACRVDVDCPEPGSVCHAGADADGACAPPCAADSDESCAEVAPGTVCFLDGRCAPESLSCVGDFECGADGSRCDREGDLDGRCVPLPSAPAEVIRSEGMLP